MAIKRPQQVRPEAKAPDPISSQVPQQHPPIKSRTAELILSGNVGQGDQATPAKQELVEMVLVQRPATEPGADRPGASGATGTGDTPVKPVELPDPVGAPAEVPEQAATTFDADTEAAISRIGARLQAVHQAELLNYHAAGTELIALAGPPTNRQPYGERIMAELSRRFETPLSTLYAARWFAQKFPDLEEFRRQHPDAVTFARVRALLVEKKPGVKKGVQDERRLVDKTFNDLEQICEQVPELGEHMNKRQIRQLHALVEQLTEVVATHLPLPVTPHSNTAEGAVKPEDDAPVGGSTE